MKLATAGVPGLAILLFAGFSAMAVAAETDVPSVGKPIELLGEQGLAGWIWYTQSPDTRKADVWKFEAGVLRCQGRPAGYIQTKMWYRDYVLDLEWRWPEGRGGNSGVLVHASAPMVLGVWPRSLEVQLGAGDAGDFWVIGRGVDINVENKESRRSDRRTTNLTDDSEKSVGEWNHMRVICHEGEIEVFVNNQKVNHGTDCTIREGGICLQSEGTPIEFRHVRLSPLPQ